MSDFLSVSIVPTGQKRPTVESIEFLLPDGIRLIDLAGSKLEFAVGKVAGRASFLLAQGGTSTDLLDRGHRNSASSKCMCKLFINLLEQFGGFAVLVQFCSGPIAAESVEVRGTTKLSLAEFLQKWPQLEDDIRYVVTWR